MPSSPSGFVYDASRGSDRGGRVREGGQKEDQGRGGVRKREQRNEELSRAAANSREIPWQSSVCTRERVSSMKSIADDNDDDDSLKTRCPLARPTHPLPPEKLVAARRIARVSSACSIDRSVGSVFDVFENI